MRIPSQFPPPPCGGGLGRGRYRLVAFLETLIFPLMNSLGIDKQPKDTRVVVAMSGGVDSCTTAALMTEAGYDVVGITLQLYDYGKAKGKPGTCCAGQDIYDARRVADTLGIPHYVLDYEKRFREEVIDTFADTYLAGETPIPCVSCNQTVKFRDLLETAKDLNADALATGHYVKRVEGVRGAELHRAKDLTRDQSYFLFATTPEQLAFLRFPLGDLDKSETRAFADKFALPVANKPDSQDICFVPTGSYADVVAKLRPGAIDPGEIVDVDGNVLGKHDGIINYTVGQRRGLGIAHPEPLYVVKLDPDSHRVIVGPHDALLCGRLSVRDINWLGDGAIPTDSDEGLAVTVKLRSTNEPVAARVFATSNNGAEVVLDEPQAGVAPGQACVMYQEDRVLGGGWIMREQAKQAAA